MSANRKPPRRIETSHFVPSTFPAGDRAATARPLYADDDRVISVDLRHAEVTCDLGTDENTERSGGGE
jgi:hypothetical protein